MTTTPRPTTIDSIATELGITDQVAISEVCFEDNAATLGHITDGQVELGDTDAAEVRRVLTAALADEQAAMAAAGISVKPPTPAEQRERFTPGYTPTDAIRVYRKRIRVGADGVATMTFRGTLHDATTMWVERHPRGGINVYAEVHATDDTATTVRVAVVPTGKRVPRLHQSAWANEATLRLGSVGGRHVYLLEVDGTVDRAAYDAERAQREADRAAERAVAQQAAQQAADAWMGLDSDDDGE